MILYQLAGLVDDPGGRQRDPMTLLDAAINARKCGLTLTGSELLALSDEEQDALCQAYEILAGLQSYPDVSPEAAAEALQEVLANASARFGS